MGNEKGSFKLISSKNRTQTWSLGLRKNGPPKKRICWKNQTSSIKKLQFVSCHMTASAEVIHFHIKSRGVQGLVSCK